MKNGTVFLTCLRLFYFILALFLGRSSAHSQGLRVGDEIPMLELSHVLNYSSNKLSLADFKGKLIILDFWGPNCQACIEAFPKLNELQKSFLSKVQIIAVNGESPDSTRRFLSRLRNFKMPQIPFVTSDTILKKYFPRNYLPWNVWIDQRGVVRYITDGHVTNFKNIETFLAGKPLDVKQLEYIGDYNYQAPVFAQSNKSYADKALYYSQVSRCISGASVRNMAVINSGTKVTKLSRNCASIRELVKKAYSEGGKYDFEPSSTVYLDVSDTLKYTHPSDTRLRDKWNENNSYSYELLFPSDDSAVVYRVMQQDICRLFNLSVSVQQKNIKCLVLKSINRVSSKGAANSGKGPLQGNPESEMVFDKKPVSALTTALRSVFRSNRLPLPLVDEINFANFDQLRINIKAFTPFDLGLLKSELNRFDLDIREEYRAVPVLVIQENR